MAEVNYGQVVKDGLWTNNAAFVQLLGLCPLLAVTGSVVNGLGLGLATTLVLIGSNVTVSLIRGVVRSEVRIPVFVLVIASFVTAIELLMNAYLYQLYQVLGIFIPLIVTNCAIIGRAEAFASRHAPGPALVDALAMGAGFTAALVVLGGLRELLGQGTLLAQMELLLGDGFSGLTLTVLPDYRGFLLAALPPGAFIGLGFLVALKNVIDRRMERRAGSKSVEITDGVTVEE
jgi:electron transport complex protein RnfE